MCGIAGYLGKETLSKETVVKSLNCMGKRGPDKSRSAKIVSSNGFATNLLFSRLSIIDLNERAMQPMETKDFAIVMNGELYNYKVLKKNLEEEFGPQPWFSESDVEVALRYISLKGIKSIGDFDGMFAMALLDKLSNKLYLARDFFGEKPLYFSKSEFGLVFASEPKIIRNISNQSPKINTRKLTQFLAYGYRSIFSSEGEFLLDIQSVRSGYVYVFATESGELVEAYKYKDFSANTTTQMPRKEILLKIKELVSDCIGRRLESDVPLAICLSGGIDSSLIAAIAKIDHGVDLTCYTVESIDPRYSEVDLARKVTKSLGLPHQIVKIEKHGFFGRLNSLTQYHESPISTISYFIQSFLMERIGSDGFKVSLMGSGADEIFTGYYDHHLAYLAGLRETRSEIYVQAVENWQREILPLIRNSKFKDIHYYSNPKNRSHLYEGSEEMLQILMQKPKLEVSEMKFDFTLLRNRMLNELFYEVIPVILHEDDRNSMMYSVENRSPYLSFDLLDFMLKVPDSQLIHNGFSKSLLREAFSGYLPEDVLFSARKIGFNASFSELCDLDSSEFRENFFDDSEFWSLLAKEAVENIFSKLKTDDKYNKISFNIVASKVFFDTFHSQT